MESVDSLVRCLDQNRCLSGQLLKTVECLSAAGPCQLEHHSSSSLGKDESTIYSIRDTKGVSRKHLFIYLDFLKTSIIRLIWHTIFHFSLSGQCLMDRGDDDNDRATNSQFRIIDIWRRRLQCFEPYQSDLSVGWNIGEASFKFSWNSQLQYQVLQSFDC